MPRPVPVHYLRGNARVWSPPCVLYLDTETAVTEREADQLLTLRLWVLRQTDRRRPRRGPARSVTRWGRSRVELARAIGESCRGRETIWCFAHNLGFDAVTTDLPGQLVAHGWALSDAAVAAKAPWFIFTRGRATLTVADSWSWLPYPLAEIGTQLGIPKPALPAETDTETVWLARCGADVDILATAMDQLMGWWDAERLGNWTRSGSATGWNAYRHRPAPARVVIDPDPDLVNQDRLSVHGGRRLVTSLGHHGAGPYAELDFVAAYPTIAAHLPVPVGRAYTFDALDSMDPAVGGDRWGVAARCLIDTDTPRWPVRVDGATWYPVGRFWTHLAGEDIIEARRLGALVQIGPGQAHKLAPALSAWAAWCLAVQHRQDRAAPPAAVLAAKAWGRSVIGRHAMRGYERTRLGPAPGSGWGVEPGWDHAAGVPGNIVDLAGVRWWVSESGVAENAYPAVLAWVEAAVRVRLGRVVAALGDRAVLQADTDGMIVSLRSIGTRAAGGHLVAPRGLSAAGRLAWCLDQIDPVTAPLVLRTKRRLSHVDLLGPQHVITSAQRRLAGIPRDAADDGPGRYVAHTWPGLGWQLAHGDPRGFVRPEVHYRVAGPYPSGWITAERRVVPVETAVDAGGVTRLVRWHQTRWARSGVKAALTQHPALDALL